MTEDKWSVVGFGISEYASTMKQLKKIIIEHLKTFEIDKSRSSLKFDKYIIKNVHLTIKRKKK